jgi:hypothetical protein
MEKSSFTFEESLAILMERFPALGLLAPTWPFTESTPEQIAPIALGNAEALYFYGLGTGEVYFQVQQWLKAHAERELIFLEEDPGKIASFLYLPEAVAILSDPQVHLALLPKRRGREVELNLLAERLPVSRLEIGALPSYKGRRFDTLRLKLLRKTTLSHALHLDRLHGYQPFQNFLQNLPRLPESFYANGLKGAFAGIPALVCGAGPSLQKSLETIRKLENKALIIAGGSTLAALSSQGILPHFGMAVDPNLEEYRRLKNSFAFEVPLLYSTRVFPGIFRTANGPFGYMRSGIGGVPELWIEEELGLLDPLLGEFLSAESISVTAICLAWAQFLGCNPILLNGVDLAYTDNKRYAAGVDGDEEVSFDGEEKSTGDWIVKRKNRQGRAVYSAVRWVMESASISHFARKHPEIRFINTTGGGIGFKGVEELSLEAVAEGLTEEYDLRGLVHKAITLSPMPASTGEVIRTKVAEMKESLDRIVGYLQILAGKERGSAALAEMELKEEMAYPYLFYDVDPVLRQALRWKFPEERWKRFLDLAKQYQWMLSHS